MKGKIIKLRGSDFLNCLLHRIQIIRADLNISHMRHKFAAGFSLRMPDTPHVRQGFTLLIFV